MIVDDGEKPREGYERRFIQVGRPPLVVAVVVSWSRIMIPRPVVMALDTTPRTAAAPIRTWAPKEQDLLGRSSLTVIRPLSVPVPVDE